MACPTFITTSLPNGTINVAYNQTINLTGSEFAATLNITAGSLPTGLSLDSRGVISGTPTVAGTYNFTITITAGAAGVCPLTQQAYTIIIATASTTSGGSAFYRRLPAIFCFKRNYDDTKNPPLLLPCPDKIYFPNTRYIYTLISSDDEKCCYVKGNK